MSFLVIAVKLFVTFILALAFGLERQKAHKPVGFGTFIFVSLGSCALGIIAIQHVLENSISLLGAVVTGIGFLGAGALIRGTDKVFGFTTAAAVWLFAIFGLIIGVGEFFISIIIYVIIWMVVIFDRHLEKKGIGTYQKKLTINTTKMINDKELNNYLLTHTKRHKIVGAAIDKKNDEMQLTFLVEGSGESLNRMIKGFYKEDWLKSAKVE